MELLIGAFDLAFIVSGVAGIVLALKYDQWQKTHDYRQGPWTESVKFKKFCVVERVIFWFWIIWLLVFLLRWFAGVRYPN
jgi:hypothetical protein